jgi:two-component system chemotaxis response regulator CheY
MKILVVDDESVSRRKMQQIMKSFGDCVAVASGAEAVAAFKEAWDRWAPFDVITLDVCMPDMDGTEVLFEIRRMEAAHDVFAQNRVKIIMVTAQSDKSTVVTSIQAGCDDYVIKPFDPDTVHKKVIRLWKERTARIGSP